MELCQTWANHCLGETTFDVFPNDVAFWRNVPAKMWAYTLGGYQVMKKWLSYREAGVEDQDFHRSLHESVIFTSGVAFKERPGHAMIGP